MTFFTLIIILIAYQIGSPRHILQNVHYKAWRRSSPAKRKRGK